MTFLVHDMRNSFSGSKGFGDCLRLIGDEKMDKELLGRALRIADRIRPRPIANEADARSMHDAMMEAVSIFPEIVDELQASFGQVSTLKQVAFNGPRDYEKIIIRGSIVPGEFQPIPAIWDEDKQCYIPDPRYNPHTGIQER